MAKESTNDRLYDAIERAKQEVFKSREVLRMNMSSTSPTSPNLGSTFSYSAETTQSAPSYAGGMGQPVVPPVLPSYGAHAAQSSSAAAAVSAVPTLGRQGGAASRSSSADMGASGCLPPSFPTATSGSSTVAAELDKLLHRAPSPSNMASPPSDPIHYSKAQETSSLFPSSMSAAPMQREPAPVQQSESLYAQPEPAAPVQRDAVAAVREAHSFAFANTTLSPPPPQPRAAQSPPREWGADSTAEAGVSAPGPLPPAVPRPQQDVPAAQPVAPSASYTMPAQPLPHHYPELATPVHERPAHRDSPPQPQAHAGQPYQLDTPTQPSEEPRAAAPVHPAPTGPAPGTASTEPSVLYRASYTAEPRISPKQSPERTDAGAAALSLSPPPLSHAGQHNISSPPQQAQPAAPMAPSLREAHTAQPAHHVTAQPMQSTQPAQPIQPAHHVADSAELSRLREALQQRDEAIESRDEDIGMLRAQNEQLEQRAVQAEGQAAMLDARNKQLEKELAEAQQQLSQRRQEFAQQKAALLLRYGVGSEPATPPQPPVQAPLPPVASRAGSASATPIADTPQPTAPYHGRERPERSRTPDRAASRSSSGNGADPAGPSRPAAGTRKPGVPRQRSRSRTPEQAPLAPSEASSFSRTPAPAASRTPIRSGFAKRAKAPKEEDLTMQEPPPALAPAAGPSAPPSDIAQWKHVLSQRRRSVHTTHPCLVPAPIEIDMAVDPSLSPCVLAGERKEVAQGLWMLTTPALGGGALLSFYNFLPDTQFNLRYTYGEGSQMRAAHEDTVDKGNNDFGVSVYPGESKPFVVGVSTSSKMSLSYGPVEALDRQPRPLQPEARQEIQAIKQMLQAQDSKRVSAADLEILCARSGLRFVDLSFPPLPVSICRLWHDGVAMLSQDVWAWRRTPLSPVGDVAAEIAGGSLSGLGMVEALALAALTPSISIKSVVTAATGDSSKALLHQHGWWQTVTVDNYFPVNVSGEPMYAHSSTSTDQRWPAVIEKAIAKLVGCYQAAKVLATGDVLSFITGSLTVPVPMEDVTAAWTAARAAADSTMAAYFTARDDVPHGTGLVSGCGYALLGAQAVGQDRLLRIRPLSRGRWQGDWSPMSNTWTTEHSVACKHDPSDGTQWISISDAVSCFSDLHVCDLRWSDATGISVAGHFEAGLPDTVLHIVYDGPPAEMLMSLYQKVAVGHPAADPDTHHAGIMASVVHQRKDEAFGIIGMTNHGVYHADRVVSAVVPLRRGLSYVVPQCFHPVDKAYVVSLRIPDASRTTVKFAQRQKGGASVNRTFPVPLTGFTAKTVLGVQGSRTYQVANRGVVTSGAGSAVRQQRAPSGIEETWSVPIRKAVKAPQQVVRADGCVPLEIVVVAGKGLNIQERQPACYCEVKLVQLNEAGEWLSLSGTLRRTRYVPDTPSPTWGETVRYPQVAASDYLFLKCFDRNLFSQDEMGEILLSLSEFIQTLAPGGPPCVNWYPLQGQGATGAIQLSISA